jgi:hypothetical protein
VELENEGTPPELSEGVRAGVVASLRRDFELRGARTARRLALAGVVGIAGALGATLLVAAHPFSHHAPWHVVVFSAIWAGLLVVTLALALLDVRTPSLPLARAAAVGLLGLGLAGICGAVCPDPHFLAWWSHTPVGGQLTRSGGLALSALCLGLAASLAIGAMSALLAIGRSRAPVDPLLPAAMLLVLLSPGVVLQSVGTSWGVLGGWLLGTAGGAYAGVAVGLRLRSLVGLA